MNDHSVGIIGVGRLGADVAFTLAERDLCDITLYDADTERAAFLASDLTDTSFGHVYNRRVGSVDTLVGLTRCDVVFISAGSRPAPGAQPAAVYEANRPIAAEIARAFVGSSTLFVVATEPVDLMTAEMVRVLRLPPSRVLGIGGVVDSFRARYLIGEAMSVNHEYVGSQVVGPHTDAATIIWEYTSVNGVPIRSLASPDQLEAIERSLADESRSRQRDLAATASRYTPAMASLELLRAIVKDDRRMLSVTMQWAPTPEYPGVAMSVPALVGRFGTERILAPPLDDGTMARICDAARAQAAVRDGGVR